MRHALRLLLQLFVLTLILGILSACGSAENPTPTLRGAFVPTRVSPTPLPTETATRTATATATETLTPSATATATSQPTSTATPTATLTLTATATTTLTLTPTVPTETPSATITNSITPESTATAEDVVPSATPADGTPEVDTIPLVYGVTVRGTITNEQPRALYQFSGESGDIVNIRMLAPNNDLDPYLRLLDENGTVLEENDDFDSNAGRDSLIDNFILPVTGSYTIVATRFDEERGIRQGDFELALTTGTYVDPPSTDEILPIEYDATLTGEITDEAYVRYHRFEGRAGDVISVEMLSESNLLDPLLILLDPNGATLIENDDDPDRNLDSLISGFTLPEDGSYLIAATRFEGISGNTTGEYSLTLTVVNGTETSSTPPVITPIVIGQPTIPEIEGNLVLGQPMTGVMTSNSNLNIYGFDGRESQNVSFSVRRLNGLFDPMLIILGPDGREIAHNDDTSRLNRDATADNLILPANGQYRVMVMGSRRRTSNTIGEFEVLAVEGTGDVPISAIQPVELAADTPVDIQLSRERNDLSAGFYGSAGQTIRLQLRRGANLGISFLVFFPLTNEVLWQGSEETVDLLLPYDGHYGIMIFARRGQGRLTLGYTTP